MNDRFLRACRREPVDRTPVWFMRQAGRYMPEYRALREKHSLLELVRTPELAVEVTLQPLRALPLDAAILFSDLLVPLAPLGIPFDFQKGEGPVFEKPVRSAADVAALRRFDPRDELRVGRSACCGASCACRSSDSRGALHARLLRDRGRRLAPFAKTRPCCTATPRPGTGWRAARRRRRRLPARAGRAGAQALLALRLLGRRARRARLPGARAATCGGSSSARRPRRAEDHFGTGTGHLLAAQREAGGSVIGVDWRTPLDEAWRLVGDGVAVQGNLDPTLLFAPRERLLARVDDVLRRANGRPGHVFNLGHGILPETPVDAVRAVTEHVHARTDTGRDLL
jgi:uroporphyrinogen decarboxylase